MKTTLVAFWCLLIAIADSSIQAQTFYDIQVVNNTVGFLTVSGFTIGTKTYGSVWVGPFTANIVDTDKPTPTYPSSFDAYCIDLFEEITPSTTVLQGTPALFSSAHPPMTDPPKWQTTDGMYKAAYLYNTFKDSVHSSSLTSTEQTARGAGLQMAIWSVLYGTQKEATDKLGHTYYYYDHSSVFTYTPDAAMDAQVANMIGLSEAANWGRLNNGTYPSQYNSTWWKLREEDGTPVQNIIGPPVPEPAEMALVGVMVAGLCLGIQEARKRLQKLS